MGYIVALRYEADGFQMNTVPLENLEDHDRFADGITLTPSDPFLEDVPQDLAERLIGDFWSLRSAHPREVEAFNNGNIPPFDPTASDADGVRSQLDSISEPITQREVKALIEAEENGSARDDVLDVLHSVYVFPQSNYIPQLA